jgi:hypothetical protein
MKSVYSVSIIVVFGFLGASVNSQPIFQKTFGGASTELGYSVQQTFDGGYVIAGYTLSFGEGNRDVYLVRTDSTGATMWTKTFGASNTDYAWTVYQTADSGYLVGAHTGSFGAGSHDIYLMRCDKVGDTIWTRAYGGSSADGVYSLQQTSDGGFILACHTSSFGAGSHDVYFVKLDAAGDTLWTRAYGGAGGDFLRAVHQTSDSGYIAVAETFSFGAGGADIYLVRTNQNGDLLWSKSYGSASSDFGYSVRQTQDGGFIVAGYTSSFGAGQFDVYLLKTDSAGALLWAKTYGGAQSDFGYSVKETNDGGYIIAGYTQSFGVGSDVYLIRTDSLGELQWSKIYGGAGGDFGWSVEQTVDGGYVVAGYTSSFGAGSNDVYLIKTDEFGNSGCNESTAATVVGDATPALVSPAATLVGSGSILNGTATVVGAPLTVDEFLCENSACLPCVAGDADSSGEFNIADVTYLIARIFSGGPPAPCCSQADANASGSFNIADVTYLIARIFTGGPAPICGPAGIDC